MTQKTDKSGSTEPPKARCRLSRRGFARRNKTSIYTIRRDAEAMIEAIWSIAAERQHSLQRSTDRRRQRSEATLSRDRRTVATLRPDPCTPVTRPADQRSRSTAQRPAAAGGSTARSAARRTSEGRTAAATSSASTSGAEADAWAEVLALVRPPPGMFPRTSARAPSISGTAAAIDLERHPLARPFPTHGRQAEARDVGARVHDPGGRPLERRRPPRVQRHHRSRSPRRRPPAARGRT